MSEDDETILAWAAVERRILITHDAATLAGYAYARVERGDPMPGVFEVSVAAPLRAGIEDLLLVIDCGMPEEFDGRVVFLPFA